MNKKFIEGLGLLVASSAHVALRGGEQLFIFDYFFCRSDSSVNKKFIEGLGLLVASSAYVALRAGEQLFIFEYFFLKKFKFKLFSAHNNCNYVVRVQNIFFKNLNFGLSTKNIFL